MDRFSFLNTVHVSEIAEMYERYLQYPDSVAPSWRSFFQGYDFGQQFADDEVAKKVEEVASPQEKVVARQIEKEFEVIKLIKGYRSRGHLFTKTNPVRERRKYAPDLSIKEFNLEEADLDREFSAGKLIGLGKKAALRKIIETLEQIYCGSIGVEYMYMREKKPIEWWRKNLNKNNNQPNYSTDAKKYIFKKLAHAVVFENFLQTKYVGQKRFSLEGGETLIPALGVALRKSAEDLGIKECFIGMAHRGRLNTLINIFRRPISHLFSEFEGKDFEENQVDGDVKYHTGFTRTKEYRNGNIKIKMNLLPNPSHLETVAPVVEGLARAKIDSTYNGDATKILPIVIHGDAAIAGQGIAYEVVQMSKLDGYKTGGTLHMVVNNQIGFTTNYRDGRSSTYCTDVAKVTLSPVLHINADDVEAVCHGVEMALSYRARFQSDVFIDLLGYRKYGHNEGDEPRFTQPKLYKVIAKHPNVKDIYLDKLLAEGSIQRAEADEIIADYKQLLESKFEESKQEKVSTVTPFMEDTWKGFTRQKLPEILQPFATGFPKERLEAIARVVSTVPDNVKFIRKAERILEGRAKMVFERDALDWGMAEMLAYGSLMEEGYDVRISGQDVERGTFSHRHAIFRDEHEMVVGIEKTSEEKRINLLNNNPENKGFMSIYNSLLSEYGVLGFDYGYAMGNPHTLTIWEAQFGDFSNGAQIIFDQYVAAAESKWKIQNGIVVLLPHGYEGQGSEHSSARIERYLQLCSRENMVVANCTTPANMFHLLRRHMKRDYRKPLIVFTPKSLLRHPKAVNPLADFAKGRFLELIDDAYVVKKQVKKLVFCTGKVYYDLLAEREQLRREEVALVRLEQLFPLHKEAIKDIIATYPKNIQYLWVQEEPRNMGAWYYLLDRFNEEEALPRLALVSRNYHAATASGSSQRHKKRQRAILDSVFD